MAGTRGLTEAQVSEFEEAFSTFDKDGTGAVSTPQLAALIRSLSQKVTEADILNLVQQVDSNGNGTVDRAEFMSMMSRFLTNSDCDEEILEAFKKFDKDGNGYISHAELDHVMKQLDEKMTEGDIDEMIQFADKDGDGEISYNEFRDMALSDPDLWDSLRTDGSMIGMHVQ